MNVTNKTEKIRPKIRILKAKPNSTQKETARQILAEMEEKDFKLLLRKLRTKFSIDVVSDGAIRSYFKEITGLESTK